MSRFSYVASSLVGALIIAAGLGLIIASIGDQNMYLLLLGVAVVAGTIWQLKQIEAQRPDPRHRDDVDA